MRIVLVALNALPAIDPAIPGPIGGIETRSWTFAKELTRQPETELRFVVRHHRPLQRTCVDGVQLVPLVDRLYPVWQSVGSRMTRQSGFPWLKVRRWSPQLLWQFPLVCLDRLIRGRGKSPLVPDPWLMGLSPDVYCTFGVQTHSAKVIASAHAAGRPAVLMLGSDGDLDPLFTTSGTDRDIYGTRADVGRFILHEADRIIVQTPEQQHVLRERFGRESVLIRNPIDVAAWDSGVDRELPEEVRDLPRFVLWVGRAENTHKRPQECLDAARACPDATFLMVMNPRDPSVEEVIRRDAPANVRIVEQVPFPLMPALFHRAAALLNTSQLEGFPNVFLQAALSKVPVVSLEVGGEFLRASRAGVGCQGDRARLAEMVRSAWQKTLTEHFDAAAAREYVVREHGAVRQAERLRSLFEETIHVATSDTERGTP